MEQEIIRETEKKPEEGHRGSCGRTEFQEGNGRGRKGQVNEKKKFSIGFGIRKLLIPLRRVISLEQ